MKFILDDAQLSLVRDGLVLYALFIGIPTIVVAASVRSLARRQGVSASARVPLLALCGALAISLATLSWTPGPSREYAPAQVIISGLLTVVLLAWAVIGQPSIWRSVAVWWAVIVGYTMGWSVIAAGTDVTGLWGVGLVILTVSLTVGLGVVAVIAHIVGVRRASASGPAQSQ